MRVLNISTPESVKDDISIMGIVISLNDLFYCSNDSMRFLLADAHIRPVDYQYFINKMVEKSVLHFFFFAERVQN